MTDFKIAVVILNWNGLKFLQQFLPKVVEYSSDVADIYVADNASSDESVNWLKENFPQIKIIINDKNYGFAQGYNVALKQIDAKYFILLNSDVEVTPNWIMPVVEHLENNPKIAAAQPKLLSYNEPYLFEYAGAAGGFIDKYGYPFCKGRIFQHIEQDDGQYNYLDEIFWASGACLFIKSETFFEVGGFDDDFFAHMEEIDLCWRLKNKGYSIVYNPYSTIYHVGGGTLPKKSAKKTYLNFRNNLILLYKNLPKNQLLKVFILRFFLDGIAAIKFLLEGCPADSFAVLKAHFHFAKNINRKYRIKRNKIQHHCFDHIYKGNIVWEHYIRKKKKFTELKPELFK
ncbi:MAG: glycosyltransferase family 2 protein [Lentimicrobiaceae bacterium]|nr:glycosyltransferase family 2 protein [Lentimicrobiaceae bacterium]